MMLIMEKKMRADFIKVLCENEIKSTEMALATESISNEIQSMVEKLSNIKTKDLADLSVLNLMGILKKVNNLTNLWVKNWIKPFNH